MILIISDYHKQEEKVLNLISTLNPSHIICCGDGESDMEFYTKNNIISVKGNCDYIDLPLTSVIEIDGKRILVTHGHLYNVCRSRCVKSAEYSRLKAVVFKCYY